MILELDHLYPLSSWKLNSNSGNWCEKRLGTIKNIILITEI